MHYKNTFIAIVNVSWIHEKVITQPVIISIKTEETCKNETTQYIHSRWNDALRNQRNLIVWTWGVPWKNYYIRLAWLCLKISNYKILLIFRYIYSAFVRDHSQRKYDTWKIPFITPFNYFRLLYIWPWSYIWLLTSNSSKLIYGG